MNIHILDLESTTQSLFDAPDDGRHAEIFQREILQPFGVLNGMFGGASGFKQWGLWPELFNKAENPTLYARFELMRHQNAWGQAAIGVEDARTCFEKYTDMGKVGNISVGLFLTHDHGLEAAGGYSGFGAIPGAVMVTYNHPTHENLACVKAVTAHEMHHQFIGWIFGQGYIISSLANYMVNEGLAESFAAELYGEDKIGPWVRDFNLTRLDETKARFKGQFDLSDFNVIRQYIFGDNIMNRFGGTSSLGIPDYAGYALGYHTVQAYLQKTGKNVVEASLVPPRELIAESGYFA